ncbi:hypothetical protein GOODEAATRI_020375 [Goodea atripinnis]|uniref:Nucleolar protein 4 n=1 Tax=Goodea atripinnis TaxID=208336 RepID=A0ABV0NCI5_9TELE
MTTRKPAGVVGDMVPISKLQTQTQQSSRGPVGGDGVPAEAAEMVGEFRDWCLKTYGDSGKTKTVTRRKYNKILQTLLQEGEEDGGAALLQEKEAGSHHINAKFKFWVRSKGFQVDRSGPSMYMCHFQTIWMKVCRLIFTDSLPWLRQTPVPLGPRFNLSVFFLPVPVQ